MRLKSLLKKISRKIVFLIPKKKIDLLIYDDIFPNPVSGFRLSEFSALLEYYKKSLIIVNPCSYPVIGKKVSEHINDLALLKKNNRVVYDKTLVGKVVDLNRFAPKIFYCIFLNIIYECLPVLEKNKVNFVFTLYPGGGFDTVDKIALNKLKKVLSSPFFTAVIVTQKFTKEFLINKFNCPTEKIHYIFGCVIPQNSLNVLRIREFKKEKDTFNICFCSAKYMEKGLDKGYDIFIDVAEKLIRKGYKIKFTVVGGFNSEDINIEGNREYFDFLGYRKYDELGKIFINQDVIISSNRPFMLSKGAFDGFPLGTVIEAGLNGVVPIVTDELNQNDDYFDVNQIIITKPDAEEIVSRVEELIADEQLLYEMSKNVRKKFIYIYNNDFQMKKRINILNQYIK
jgi:glycosyltransferase involved in cell wall biosynthesis